MGLPHVPCQWHNPQLFPLFGGGLLVQLYDETDERNFVRGTVSDSIKGFLNLKVRLEKRPLDISSKG
jgi:hypothetical protein